MTTGISAGNNEAYHSKPIFTSRGNVTPLHLFLHETKSHSILLWKEYEPVTSAVPIIEAQSKNAGKRFIAAFSTVYEEEPVTIEVPVRSAG